MNRRSAGAVILLSAASLPAGSSAAATSGQQGEYLYFLPEPDRTHAAAVAQQLLVEFDTVPIDARRLAGVYQRSAPAMRNQGSEAAFIERVSKYRAGLGARRERVLQGVEGGFRFLPNLPDGQYAIVVFDTVFGPPSPAPLIYTEQLTLARDPARGSSWEMVDYYLDLKPFYKY